MAILKTSKIIKVFLPVLIFLSILFGLCACTAVEQNDNAEQVTESILDGIVSGDYDETRSMFKNIASDKDFRSFFDTVSEMLSDTKSYELKQVGWHSRVDNGISTYSVTFEMSTDDGEKYMVETHFLKDDNSLYSFNITPTYSMSNNAVIPFQIVFVVISFASCAFCVWMIIDCSRRKIRKKPLWIILILLSFSLMLTFGNELGMNFTLRLNFPLSNVTVAPMSVAFKLTIPVGAIIYFIVRKKLTPKIKMSKLRKL